MAREGRIANLELSKIPSRCRGIDLLIEGWRCMLYLSSWYQFPESMTFFINFWLFCDKVLTQLRSSYICYISSITKTQNSLENSRMVFFECIDIVLPEECSQMLRRILHERYYTDFSVFSILYSPPRLLYFSSSFASSFSVVWSFSISARTTFSGAFLTNWELLILAFRTRI